MFVAILSPDSARPALYSSFDPPNPFPQVNLFYHIMGLAVKWGMVEYEQVW